MQSTLLRRIAAPIAVGAVTAGSLFAAAIPAHAEITTTKFKNACRASSVIDISKSEDSGVTVDAPAAVEPGETFTYTMQVLASAYPNKDSGASTTNISRYKWDFEIPDNVEFISATHVGNGINLDGKPPSVIQINDDGKPDEAGAFLRLSGNNEVIGNGTDNDTQAEGGIRAPKEQKNLDGSPNSDKDSHFQAPAVAVTVKAGESGVIQPKIRTAGAAGDWDNDRNWNTLLPVASVPIIGTQWAPTRCAPMDDKDGGALNAGAGPLATINIGGAQGGAETATTAAAPTTAETGQAENLTATATPAETTGTPWWQWAAGVGVIAVVVTLAAGLIRRRQP